MLIQKTVDETGVWESGAGGANKVTSHCQLPRVWGGGGSSVGILQQQLLCLLMRAHHWSEQGLDCGILLVYITFTIQFSDLTYHTKYIEYLQ